MVAAPLQSRKFSSRQARQQRMVGDSREELPQPVLLDTEAEALFQDLGRLLEYDDLEPVADGGDVGAGPSTARAACRRSRRR